MEKICFDFIDEFNEQFKEECSGLKEIMKKSLKKHLKELKELDKKKMEDSKEEDGCVTPRDNILTNEVTDSIKDLNINDDKNMSEKQQGQGQEQEFLS